MLLKLTGALRRNTEANDTAFQSWKCPICSTENGHADDNSSLRCKTCQRLRSPQWLHLEDSGLQLELGSRVFHTSASGSKSVVVVIALDFVRKAAILLRMKVKRNEGQPDDISFHEVALNASQMQQQLELLDDIQDEDCMLDNYGVCGECRGIFHLAQGDPQSRRTNEDKVNELREELRQLTEKKKQLVTRKEYQKTLECSELLKIRTKQLQIAKRKLEFLCPVFCPFCGWSTQISSDRCEKGAQQHCSTSLPFTYMG